jgi:DNA adenine methylase
MSPIPNVEQNNKIFIPPIKCQGIKSKLALEIQKIINWSGNGKWIEPFMGSGVIGFNVKPKKALFCDVNPHIINFYQNITKKRITPSIVKDFLEQEGKILSKEGQEYYYTVRNRFNMSKHPLDFLFLNRSCFNGVIRFNSKGGFNVPFGHKRDRFAQAYITKIVNQVSYVYKCVRMFDWDFICQDFSKTISHAQKQDFIYCDPPYIDRHTNYFDSWSSDSEIKLFDLLKHTPAKFILSTWHSNEYRTNQYLENYWSNFNVKTFEHFYHVGAKELNRKPMLEALVYNYKELASKLNQNRKIQHQEHQILLTI